MKSTELIEIIARALCVDAGYDPNGNNVDCRFDNESADGWENWFYFKPETHTVLRAISPSIKKAYDEINAIGGSVAAGDEIGKAINDTVGEALEILERHGLDGSVNQ